MTPEIIDLPTETPPPPTPQWPPPDQSGGGRLAWLWILLLVLIVSAGGWYYWTHMRGTPAAAGAGKTAGRGATTVPVLAATARVGDLPMYLDGLGTVTPLNTVALHTRVDGQIISVNYKEGQQVKQGELLLTIDDRPFKAQLEQAQGQIEKDQAVLENARLDLKRYMEAGSAVPQVQLDTQKALIQQDEGAVKVDQAAIDNANLQLTYCNVTSPINGRIGLRLVNVGNIVHASDASPVAMITETQPITVIFTLPENSIQPVIQKMNKGVALDVAAYNRDLKHKLADGKLMAADSQIDPTTGNLRFKALFDNADGILFPNQFVNARLLLQIEKGVVIVPAAAVQRSPTGTFIYVAHKGMSKAGKPQETVAMQVVKLGPVEGDQASITSGIKAGDIVVTDGVDKLTDGAVVSVSQATAKPNSTTTKPGGAAQAMPRAAAMDEAAPNQTRPGAVQAAAPTDKMHDNAAESGTDGDDKASGLNAPATTPSDRGGKAAE